MQNNIYKEFAQIYDLLMDDVDYEKWVAFIINKLGNSRKILEAACGTGSITCLLSENNYNITAFDISEDMLMKAYEKLRKNPNVKILNQDMSYFEINDSFDTAICCCDGINYLLEKDVKTCFKCIKKHLNEGGNFIFDISTPIKYEYMYNSNSYVYDDGKIFYVWENNINDNMNSIESEINFFVKNSNGMYNRITEVQTQYIYKVDKIREYLLQAGFIKIQVYDDYTDKQYTDSSMRAVFVCQ